MTSDAEYKLLSNGKIRITNSCLTQNGTNNIINGTAVPKYPPIVPNSNIYPGVLKIKFDNIPFTSDYNIIGIYNYNGIDYSLVGSNNRKYFWILARYIPNNIKPLNDILQIAKSNNYNIDKLIINPSLINN